MEPPVVASILFQQLFNFEISRQLPEMLVVRKREAHEMIYSL